MNRSYFLDVDATTEESTAGKQATEKGWYWNICFKLSKWTISISDEKDLKEDAENDDDTDEYEASYEGDNYSEKKGKM